MSTIAPAPAVPIDEEGVAEATRLADGFLAGANELDAIERARLIAEIWTDGCHFVDPLHEANGHDGFESLFAQVHTNFPGYVFRRTSDVEQLQRWMRFSWDFRDEDGSLLVAGTDIAERGDDGRLVRIVSFYDHLESD